jgi:ankyrin repeat protein
MESTRNDIETYIDLKWAEHHHKEPYLPPPPTRRDITNVAGGYWPFVKFAVEDVRFTSTSHDPKPRSFAEQLPAGLEQHYLALILPILQSVDNNDVLRTFLILVASKTAGDSLRVPQWTEALKSLHNYDEGMQGDLPELLRRHLGSLLSVSKLGEISVHSTSFAVYLRTLLTPTQKASNMAFLCVKYLLQDRFSDPSSQLRDRSRFWEDSPDKMDSFYKYAATYWVTYVANLKTFDTKLQEVLCKFLSGDCPQFKTWQIARGEMIPGTPDRYTKDAPVTALLYEGATSFFQQFVPAPTELTPEIGLVPRVKEALQRLLSLQTKQLTATISIPNWPNIVDHRGRTPLMAAAHSGQVDLVEYLLKWPTDINARANRGESVLFVALSMNRSVNRYYLEMMESVVDVLLRHGANPNQCDRQGITPLQIACAGDMLPIAKRLMDAGASINAGNVHGGTPLSRAIEKDNEDLLMELLRRRVAVDIWLAVGETPLTWCIINDKRQIFNLLLDITDVNLAREGFGPIHAAAVDPERIEFLRALLTRGDIDVDMGAPGTALHSAIEGGNYEGAELLLQAGAFTGLLPNMSIPPLVAAVRKGDISLVELLLNYQAPINEISHTSPEKTALTTAVRMKRCDLVSLLLSRGADPSIEDGLDIRGPLHIACAEEKPDLDIIRLLLEAAIPPDINFVPTGRNHVLMSAVWDDDVALAKLLLQHGVDMNLWLESGGGSGAPLHVAAEKGNLEICKAMLELEPKLLNTQREDVDLYESPLHSACFKGQRKVVQYFLQQGAKADQLSYYYESSPLLLACEAGDKKIVKLILHAAPHMVNVASYLMETPLMKACGTGNLQVIELLLKVGADIYARDTYGDSCVAFAFNDEKKASTPKILDLLLQYGLKINSVLSGDGSTLLEEAISRGNARDVRWVLEKGGDPVQYGELPGRPNSWNALQHAFKSGDKEVIDILLEPRWGLWQHITTPDWYGSSGLYMFTPRRSRAGGMALLLEKSEAQRAITGEDAFAEMMHQRTITGFSALDYALGCSGVLPAARQDFNKAVGSCLEKLVSCERTTRDHSMTLMDMGLLLMLLPEHRSDAQTLLSASLSLPDIDWDNDVISRSVCCYWSCQVCNEPIRDLCCVCLGCQTCSCNGCRDKLNWKATHEHEWLDVPLIKDPDLNSPNIQEILEKVVREMLHTPDSEEASAQPLVVKTAEEEEQERLQSGLQLAVLHAFNYLAVRRPAWTPYLPLSSPAEALIAPFTELISEQRRSIDRWNLFLELSPWRLEEEMRYFSRSLTQSYSDEQLVHHDMAMQRVRELFPVDDDVSDWSDSEDGRPRPRVRPRMAPPPGWNGRPPPPPPWGAAKVGPRIEVKNVM